MAGKTDCLSGQDPLVEVLECKRYVTFGENDEMDTWRGGSAKPKADFL